MNSDSIPARPITVKDVARAANVSPMTVSRVVNGAETVAPELAARVRQAVAALGYVPNGMAKQLRGGRSGLVAAVFPTLQESIYLQLVEALARELGAAGFQLFVGQSNFHPEEEADLLDDLVSRRPDALLVVGRLRTRRARDQVVRSHVPLIELWDYDDASGHASIGLQHAAVGAAVAQHFVGKGRRHLAYIGASEERSRKRCEAFVKAACQAGLAQPAVFYVDPPTTVRLGRETSRELWHRNGPVVDAIFCSSDILALGVLTELSSLGAQVGSDVSVMGFGDFPIGREGPQRLSTVHVDIHRIAELTAAQLLASAGSTPFRGDVGFTIEQRDT